MQLAILTTSGQIGQLHQSFRNPQLQYFGMFIKKINTYHPEIELGMMRLINAVLLLWLWCLSNIKRFLIFIGVFVGNTNTISYSTISYGVFDSANYFDPDTAIISAIHPYLDFITLSRYYEPLSQEMLTEIEFLGIPLSKISIIMMGATAISGSISPLITDSSVSGFSHTCVENAQHLQIYNCVAFFTHVCFFPHICVQIQTCVEQD